MTDQSLVSFVRSQVDGSQYSDILDRLPQLATAAELADAFTRQRFLSHLPESKKLLGDYFWTRYIAPHKRSSQVDASQQDP